LYRIVMKKNGNKISATIIFLAVVAITLCTSNYLANYEFGRSFPKWIRSSIIYIMFAGVILAGAKFVEAFEKDNKKSGERETQDSSGDHERDSW